MHKILVFAVVAILAMTSCQAPLSLNRQAVNLALTVSYTSPHVPTTSTQARLLLPTATYVQLTLKDAQGKVTQYMQTLSSNSNAVFSLSNLVIGNYTLTGQAFADAALTTSLFANSITATISTSTTALNLYLLPTSSTTISAGTPVTGSLDSATSATFLYTLTSASDSLTLVNLPSGVSYYLQKSDGMIVADASGSIAASATDGTLLLTLYNSTATTAPYNFSVKESGVSLGVPQWAVTTTASFGGSSLNAATVDASGNVLVAGYLSENYSYTFGDSANIQGVTSSENPLLIKLSPTKHVLWAQSGGGAASGDNFSFSGVATDASNNVYAAGTSSGTKGHSYTFGSTPNVSTAPAAGSGSILVKFDSSGNPVWVTSSSLSQGDTFTGVAADAAGNSWAVGSNSSNAGTVAYGSGAQGSVDGSGDLIIAKFDTTGAALWVSACYSSSSTSSYHGVAIDSSDNSYAVGTISGSKAFYLGTDSSVPVTGTSSNNAVLVKYNSTGTPQWAKAPTSGFVDSAYNGVAVDSTGNAVAVGTVAGGSSLTFGNGQSVTGGDIQTSDTNAVIVKYDTGGNTLWARTVSAAAGASAFTSVSVDKLGNSYAVGTVTGVGTYSFGTHSITVPTSGSTLVIVKYDASGTEQWAQTIQSGSNTSQFAGVAVDQTTSNAYAVGNINSTKLFDFGNGVTATGTYASVASPLVVQYQ